MPTFRVLGTLAVVACLAVVPERSPAQDTGEVLTLEDALTLALIDNPSVENAGLDIEKAGDEIDAASAEFFPKLEAKVHTAHNLIEQSYTFDQGVFGTYPGIGPIPATTTEIESADNWSSAIGLSVTQSLVGIYKVDLEVESLTLEERIAAEHLRLELQDTARLVKQQYYQILATQSALADTQAEIALYEALAVQLGEEVIQQTALEYELLDAEARLAAARQQELTQRNDIASQKEQLNNLMGRDTTEPFQVAGSLGPPVVLVDDDIAVALALEQRPELRVAELDVALAGNQIEIAEAAYLPDADVLLSYARNDSDLLPDEALYVGLIVTWEFYDWGRRASTEAADGVSERQAMNDLRQTQSDIIADVNASLRDVENALAAIEAARVAQAAGAERLRVTQNRYAEQVALLTDLFDASDQLAEANDDFIEAVLAAHGAQAELARAMGEQ